MLLYRIIGTILSPIFALYSLYRVVIGKDNLHSISQKLSIRLEGKQDKPLIWIHAVSIGEVFSITHLVDELLSKFRGYQILITSTTLTSAEIVKTRLAGKATHSFLPLDVDFITRRFLKYWDPKLVIWTESELWPGIISMAAKKSRLYLVNARMSDKSFSRWMNLPKLAEYVLDKFELIFPQSLTDKEKYRQLGAKRINFIGNIKYDAPPLPAGPSSIEEARSNLSGRKIWLAASTHSGEEEIIADAHNKLKQNIPDLLTIIVPRHPERAREITAMLQSKELSFVRRSSEDPIKATTDIYLADTIGELGIFYRVTDIVLIGGSLVNVGGHNPIEPAKLGCSVIIGQYHNNFKDMVAEFATKQAIIKVDDANELATSILKLTQDEKYKSEQIAASKEAADSYKGITKQLAELIYTKFHVK